LADVDAGTVIAQTKQVNDLNSLDNRQAGYTNKFSLPKTANNLRIMQFLTLVGNNSAVPYQKNDCSLYSASGECFVYNGWAVITDGGDSYEAVVYDGIIELYKAIENQTLADLRLDFYNHDKNMQNVTYSWTGAAPYLYILADYNGNTGNTAANVVDIDYLVPAIRVEFLWQAIASRYQFDYGGSVFNTPHFKNLYLTYPKGVVNGENDRLMLHVNGYNLSNPSLFYWPQVNLNWSSTLVNELVENATTMQVPENGNYKVRLYGTLLTTSPVVLKYRVNAMQNGVVAPGNYVTVGTINSGETFSHEIVKPLNAFDSITLTLFKTTNNGFRFVNGSFVEGKMFKLSGDSTIDFSQALSGFTIKDFLTEVVQRFGLTMYKEKYSNFYTFLTLQEQLQGNHIENWSGKFIKKISEKYLNGSYAQRNWFRYQYNDKEASHNDYSFNVSNVNLPDNRDAIKSKIYSPERDFVNYLGRSTNVYKLWDKELVENPAPGEEPYTYKPLDKRFYFLKAIKRLSPITVRSVAENSTISSSAYYTESFYKLPFSDVVQDFYDPLKQILDKACIITAEIWLTDVDITAIDFKKLYYIEQLASYFTLNKIENYIPGKVTKCELVRVQYTGATPPETITPVPNAITFKYIMQNPGNARMLSIKFAANFNPVTPYNDFQFQYSTNFITWTTLTTPAGNNTIFIANAAALPAGTYHFRMYAPQDALESDYYTLTL